MVKYFEFECGCKWPIIKESENPELFPELDVDMEHLPDCNLVWKLIGRGDTKGVFQLESRLGQTWAKRLIPESIEHMSALVALIRPGCLNVKDDDGISMTEHYCRRKNKEELSQVIHEELDPILAPTEQSILYQEQCMRLGAVIAGFDLKQVDRLRKAIGKKSLKEMVEVKKEFLEGAKLKNTIPYELAETVWGWIEKSGRYLFNKSHSVSYGMMGYDTAYLKSHFPVQFFTSWLYFSKDKLDPDREKIDLIEDAKKFGIKVFTPRIEFQSNNFHTDGINVYFGLKDIKGIGDSSVKKFLAAIQESSKEIKSMTWIDWLYDITDKSFATMQKMIMAGCFDSLKIKRQKMLADIQLVGSMTNKEVKWLKDNARTEDFIGGLRLLSREKPLGGCANEKRRSAIKSQIQMLENPPTDQNDNIPWVIWAEEQAFGLSVTYSRVEAFTLEDANCTCRDYMAGKSGMILMGVEVKDFRVIITKKGKAAGKEMAFVAVSDQTGFLDGVICFPETWENYKQFFVAGNTILIRGERDRNGVSLIVQSVSQLT